jgi:antitoxin YefM
MPVANMKADMGRLRFASLTVGALERSKGMCGRQRDQIDSYQMSYMPRNKEIAMDVLTYTDTRARLKEVMDQVVADSAPVIVSRTKGKPVVMVSLDDWNAMAATLHLLSTPANAQRLLSSIEQLDAGEGVERDLIEG